MPNLQASRDVLVYERACVGSVVGVDSSGGIIIGALIALVGSIVGGAVVPWVREIQTRKAILRDERRRALEDTVRSILALAWDVFFHGLERDRDQSRQAAMKETTLLFELDILLGRADADVYTACMSAFNALRVAPGGKARDAVVAGLAAILPAWLRGDMTPATALAYMDKQIAATNPPPRD